ncbi:MAG TPA: tetratricopeptide repeat protein [Candidatus Acidoferrales bacterium]|nr:tetratricopeptide repeat protein [Candidatus Acidoferrales bacterium]
MAEAPTESLDPAPDPARRALPERIGPYKILEILGQGGMGIVYLAEQETPIRRKVALKVIKLGMDTQEVIARFESERQALAMMNHPNIAQVHEAGTTDRGAPYFVMEYVPGLPVSDYCDKHRLSTRERLELFVPVCRAIQHAHQKGIIHRDIKPSNLLVTVQDGRPVPKIIDFGVAKATNQRLTEKTVFTQQGYLIGTPEYMSPEQAEMSGLDVDTTTDIYSLGVLLYELLVGALPFDPKALRRAGFDEIRRMIREVEPPKPTTRLSGLGPLAKEVADRRHTDVGSLQKELAGDLEWITLKAIEKDRTRRYPSSSELAADIERHLRNEPVIASPPSTAYRLRKFVLRHRVGAAAASCAVVLLAAFAIAMALQAQRIARERDRAERVTAFLVSLFEASDPEHAKGREVTARELLDRGMVRLQGELKDEPQTRASLFHTIGVVFVALDRKDSAKAAFEQAAQIRRTTASADRLGLAETLKELGHLEADRGNLDRAEAEYREALTIRRSVLGDNSVKVADSLTNLGNIQWYRGRMKEAEKLYREAVATAERGGASDDDIARLNVAVAAALSPQDRLEEEIGILTDSLATLRRTRGPENNLVLRVINNLSATLSNAGRYDEAERLQRELLATRRKILGNEHYDVALALYNLGNTLHELGRLAEAEAALAESRDIWRKSLPQPHVQVAWALNDLAGPLREEGRLDDADQATREALDIFQKAPSSRPVDAAWAWQGLGEVALLRGRPAEAEKDFRAALKIRQEAPGAGPEQVAASEAGLGRVLCESGATVEGERLLRDAAALRQKALPASHWRIAFTQALLGRCLTAEKRYADAEPLLLNAYEALRAKRGEGREDTAVAATGLATLYEAWGKPDRAAPYRKQAR